MPMVNLLIMNKLVNTISYIIQGEIKYYHFVIFLIIIQCIANVILFSMTHLQQLLTTKMEFELNHFLEKEINLKLDNLPYENLEYPDFYNRFNRVLKNGSIASKLLDPVQSFIEIMGSLISLISIVTLLFNIHWILVILSIVSFFPFLLFNSQFGKENYNLIRYQTLDKRKTDYYKSLLQDKQSIKEIRLFNLTKYFTNKWEYLYIKSMRESIHLISKQTRYRILMDFFKYFIYGIASFVVMNLISAKKAKIGDFVMIIQAIQQVQSMSAVLATSISKIYSHIFHLNDYFDLLDVIEGVIKINNKVIEQYNIDSLRKRVTVIFQDFMRYAFTIRENIEIGDTDHSGDNNRFYYAAKMSGVSSFAEQLTKGYDTHLGNLFEEGVDLSGGQWQKIAIARSLFRNSDVLILDEPTSSLDPKSEYEIYKRIEELALGRITINISHRLAYVKNVDKIYVLDKGCIVEKGTHNELIKKKGAYYEMYSKQSKMFNDKAGHEMQSSLV